MSPEKWKRERARYARYLKSPRWQAFRRRAIRAAGKRCTRCSRPSTPKNPLQVHHLHYETLYREKLSDVQVLCKTCHQGADQARKKEVEQKMFENWAGKVYGPAVKDFDGRCWMRVRQQYELYVKARRTG